VFPFYSDLRSVSTLVSWLTTSSRMKELNTPLLRRGASATYEQGQFELTLLSCGFFRKSCKTGGYGPRKPSELARDAIQALALFFCNKRGAIILFY